MALNGSGLNSGGLRSGGLRKTTEHAASVGAQRIDSFESGDMAAYTGSEANGGASAFTATSAAGVTPIDGDYLLTLTDDTTYPKAISTSGLGAYPAQGDEWSMWVRFDADVGASSADADLGIYFGSQDVDNTYYVNVRPYEDSVRVYEDDAGAANGLASATSVGLQGSSWYKVIVRWHDGSTFGGTQGDITFILEDAAGNQVVALENVTPTVSYQNAAFGVYGAANSSETIYWDHAVIASEDDTGSGGGGGSTIESFESQSLDAYSAISDEGSEVFYWTDPKSDAPAIGGGPGYADTIAEADADVTVASSSELRSAADSASAGDIIYATSNIDTVGESEFTIPAGVTLAGDRGINGSPGPVIYVGKRNRGFYLNTDARLTGLRVEGPWPDTWSTESKSDDDWHQKGVNANGDNVEIDNCEIYGFGYSCLQLTNDNASDHPDGVHIHHCNIHHGVSNGWGYGCDTYQATNALFEHCRFAHCRHQITGSGQGSYTVRHCLLEEPNTHNVIDMHQPGGIRTDVYRNTIVAHDTGIDGLPGWASSNEATSGYIQREIPQELAEIHNNWMWNPYPPPPDKPENPGFDRTAIDQAFPDSWEEGEDWSWENVEFWDNEYDADSLPASDRRARDGRRCRDEGERCLVYYGSRKTRGLLSTSGLDNYPSAGDTWRFYWRGEGWPFGLCQILFAVQDESQAQDYYELDIRESEIRLEVDVDGDDTELGSAVFNWDSNIPYEIEVAWPEDPASTGITVTVTNHYSGVQAAQFTADPDDTYITGGIGFYGNSWSGFLLDDFSIVG